MAFYSTIKSHRIHCFQKFVDNTQQCFAFTAQANFPAHNLNFHWRWRWLDQIQANFLIIFYFKIQSGRSCWKFCGLLILIYSLYRNHIIKLTFRFMSFSNSLTRISFASSHLVATTTIGFLVFAMFSRICEQNSVCLSGSRFGTALTS